MRENLHTRVHILPRRSLVLDSVYLYLQRHSSSISSRRHRSCPTNCSVIQDARSPYLVRCPHALPRHPCASCRGVQSFNHGRHCQGESARVFQDPLPVLRPCQGNAGRPRRQVRGCGAGHARRWR